jgi:hypothetical protein
MKRVKHATAILALFKRGKKGKIKIRKLRIERNTIKERRKLMVKSEVNIVRNLRLRSF